MRSLSGRLQRLEAKLAPRRDEAGRSLVDVIRERRHRRLAANHDGAKRMVAVLDSEDHAAPGC